MWTRCRMDIAKWTSCQWDKPRWTPCQRGVAKWIPSLRDEVLWTPCRTVLAQTALAEGSCDYRLFPADV
jgi:hypothetical protein